MQSAIESVAALAAAQAEPSGPGMSRIDGPSAPDAFFTLVQREVGQMNASVNAAEASMRDLAAGKQVELHDVMINLERARISVQTFVQVRNKLVESYQDLMRMQL